MVKRCAGLFAVVALSIFVAIGTARALEVTEWKYRQPLTVEQPGVLKLALPPETLGLARSNLEDLRLLDPAGREVPFVFTTPAPAVPPVSRAPVAFRATLQDGATELLVTTGTTAPLEAVALATPAPHFLKPARVEISADGEHWELLADRRATFRQFGAEHLQFQLERRTAAYIRITIDDTRHRAVPFTGATLLLAGTKQPEFTAPIEVRIVRREEFAGESVLTLDLGGAHVPLAELGFVTAEPLFARTITLTTRELRDEAAVERTLVTGSIWRIEADGVAPAAQLTVAAAFTTPSRELLVHVANGDSPPLAIDRVTARQRPLWFVFRAAESGTYTLLTGNAQVAAPRYDLAPLAAQLRDLAPSALTPGAAQPNPGYRATDGLADTPLLGAAIDPAPWRFRKPVRIATPGVQQLELDLDVLARAQPGFADLRLVHDDAQVPYLLERTALARTTPLAVEILRDPKRPHISRWQITLPRASLPVTKLTLTSSTPIFQRQMRLYEKVVDERRGDSFERSLGNATWSHTPGDVRPLTLPFPTPPVTGTFVLETDDGDNPPIALTAVAATYPVVRLLFKTDAEPLELYYGNAAATTPRYDLALVGGQIFAAEKSVATLGAEEQAGQAGWGAAVGGSRAGMFFWAALGLVVVVLLVVVAKLLPKPPVAKS
ncbi:DUF3999 family protein [Opitutus terrae]|uniref:Transmembrane protein n=1 Tax=Opitutus terrae (strain DSM 11246 / JCM 15787 / PB90-1) TaxID=452637 RepID=B1ZQC4_OPITP|nr:DUF3999 family protein [Opitutus terrae]ACB73604.1 hypothetical protein Oter_0314 [Opitutus terrae PB90-1]